MSNLEDLDRLYDHPAAAQQAFKFCRGAAEGYAGNDQQVDPGLELAGDAPVVHRGADDNRVCSLELLQDFLAGFQFVILVSTGSGDP